MFKAVFNDVQFSVYDSVMIAVAVGLLIQAKFIGYFGVMVV